MNRQVQAQTKVWQWALAIGIGLLGLLASVAIPRSAMAQENDLVRVVSSFIEAINNRDAAAMRALATQDLMVVANPGTRYATEQDLEKYIAAVQAEQTGLKILDIKGEGQSVVANVEFTGSPILARLPNPATARITFTITEGRVAKMVIVFSEQTLKDLDALLGQLPQTQPTPQPTQQAGAGDATQVVLAFIEAINKRDASAMRSLATKDFRAVTDLGNGPTEASLDEFISSFQQTPQEFKLVVGKVQQSGSTIVVELIFAGVPGLETLPHPFTTIATFTVTDGLIARMELALSEQTRKDIADQTAPPMVEPGAHPEAEPGMPRTGENTIEWTTLATALVGLSVLTAGILFRRRTVYMES